MSKFSLSPPSLLNRGLLAGALTGVFWGLPFLAPQVLTHFGAVEIAFGRFFFFGLVSLFFFKRVFRIFLNLGLREWVSVLFLSASGFWFYSALLFWGIQRTDGILSSLVLGMLPVTIPLFSPGSVREKRKALPGISLIFLGLLLLFLVPVLQRQVRSEGGFFTLPGFAVLVLCLGLWTAYAIANGNFLKTHPQISGRDLSSVMGVVSLLAMLPWVASVSEPFTWWERPGFGMFVLVSLGLGAGSSWFANWLWNYCSTHVPASIAGTLLVFETLFGLIYSFGFERRWPLPHEGVAMVLCLAGVLWSVRSRTH